MDRGPGRAVRGLLQSDDLSTATPVILYDEMTQEVVTLGAKSRFIIYLLSVSNGATAVTVTVFDDADADGVVDTGETIFKQAMAAGGLGGFEYVRGIALSRLPKIKSSAGSVGTSITILGEVQSS